MRRKIRKVSSVRNEIWTSSVRTVNQRLNPFLVDCKMIAIDDFKRENSKKQSAKSEIVENAHFSKYFIDGVKKLFEKGSLHGFKYIIESSKSPVERIIWAIICLISIVVCMFTVHTIISKWLQVPFIMVFDNDFTPMYDVPFPKVMICPENTVKKSYMEITKITDPALLFAASLLCDEMPPQNFSMPDGTPLTEDEKIIDFLENSTPTCNEMLKYCTWLSISGKMIETTDCCLELFEPILTNNGMCYGFNMLTDLKREKIRSIEENSSLYKWTPQDEYNLNTDNLLSYPRRTYGVGEYFGLSVHLYLNVSDSQPECDGPRFGFKVLTNSPLESVMDKTYATIPMKKQTSLSVTPEKLTTENSIKSLSPNLRQCYFEGEKKLTFFEYYTFYNCIQDCETSYIIKYCNCVPFHFKQYSPNTQICKSYKNYICLHSIKGRVDEGNIMKYYAWKNSYDLDEFPKDSKESRDGLLWCKCFPGCFTISYNSEAFFIDLIEESVSENPIWQNYSSNRPQSILKVYFRNLIFFGHRRKLQYDFMDFVAAIGGIMSLFLGFSLMSIVELIYYVILKPIVLTVKQKLHSNSLKKECNTYLP